MFASSSECLAVYEARLKAAAEWTKSLKESGRFVKGSRIDMATEAHWRQCLNTFIAMEQILGLTSEEASVYRKKHGVFLSLPEWMNAIRN